MLVAVRRATAGGKHERVLRGYEGQHLAGERSEYALCGGPSRVNGANGGANGANGGRNGANGANGGTRSGWR